MMEDRLFHNYSQIHIRFIRLSRLCHQRPFPFMNMKTCRILHLQSVMYPYINTVLNVPKEFVYSSVTQLCIIVTINMSNYDHFLSKMTHKYTCMQYITTISQRRESFALCVFQTTKVYAFCIQVRRLRMIFTMSYVVYYGVANFRQQKYPFTLKDPSVQPQI